MEMYILFGIGLLFGLLLGWVIGWAGKNRSLQKAQVQAATQAKECEILKANLAEEQEKARLALRDQMDALKLVFQDTATKLMEEKVQSLSATNENGIKTLLEPLQCKMEAFQKAVENTREKSVEQTASLTTQIKAMMEQTFTIGKEANNLASALKGSNKIQGNWGEVVLGTLLDGMGLQEGVHYAVQGMLRDADGRPLRHEETDSKLIPDVLLFLPDNKAVVIDAKVSLSAYVDYCNASDEATRDEALKRHVKSMEDHYKELSRKNYSKYVKETKRESLPYVVMFTPNEGAFQLFYQQNRALWHKAFENNVIIAGESNLFAMLRIIETAWIQIKQQKNLETIMETSQELLQRVSAFVNTFDDIGKCFGKTMEQYNAAQRKLRGRQSVATTAHKLTRLGLAAKEPIKALLPDQKEDDAIEEDNAIDNEQKTIL